MNLTIKIKLFPTGEQAKILLQTIRETNAICNIISDITWGNKKFGQFDIHHNVYHKLRASTNFSAQMLVRCVSKVADAYKVSKKIKSFFKPLGSIAYDNRILSFKPCNTISIWSIEGRLKIPFICHNEDQFKYVHGEGKLFYKKGKFYILQKISIPEPDSVKVTDFIGCDFGQVDVCTLSDGTNFNSKQLKKVRKKYSKVRASVQAKGTKSSRRLLKRLSGRERRFVSINNHYISKQIVQKAVSENKGIAIEDLTHIRKNAKPKSKAQKIELNRWSFYQLRQHLTYKAKLSGVKIFAIPPAYTSQMCNNCFYIGDRKGKRFICTNCGNISDADHNAAKNIAAWGCAVNQPESSILYCVNALHN